MTKIKVEKISDNKGRGVVATEDIAVHETIEKCEVIDIPSHQLEKTISGDLNRYYFEWYCK